MNRNNERVRLMLAAGLLVVVLLPFVACDNNTGTSGNGLRAEIFGNGQKDVTKVIARVGDLEITQKDFDLRYEELSDSMKRRYSGENWKRSFLKTMVDEYLLYTAAVDEKLYLDASVAQQLISAQRIILGQNYEAKVLLKDNKPTDQEIRQYYEANKVNMIVEGKVRAQHIECNSQVQIMKAYDRLMNGSGQDALFAYVVGDFSENERTARENGHLGWFNKGGLINYINDSRAFSEAIYDWDYGIHEPILIGGKWHIVEILERENERFLTLAESRDRILREMQPMLNNACRTEFLDMQKKNTVVEFMGEYQLGNGLSADELYKLGVLAKSFDKQELYLNQVIDDFPDSEYAPKALFTLANLFMDEFRDQRNSRNLLFRLITTYPDCDMYEDAKYMLDNLGKRNLSSPKSIDELRNSAE